MYSTLVAIVFVNSFVCSIFHSSTKLSQSERGSLTQRNRIIDILSCGEKVNFFLKMGNYQNLFSNRFPHFLTKTFFVILSVSPVKGKGMTSFASIHSQVPFGIDQFRLFES